MRTGVSLKSSARMLYEGESKGKRLLGELVKRGERGEGSGGGHLKKLPRCGTFSKARCFRIKGGPFT